VRELRAPEIEIVRVDWKFVARPDGVGDFEKCYRSSGSWAELFQRSEGFRGTVLPRDTENARRFLTADSWDNASAYRAMRAPFRKEYIELDRACEGFAESERRIGEFEER
jgi:heme-degrading monooxygenase HmoA